MRRIKMKKLWSIVAALFLSLGLVSQVGFAQMSVEDGQGNTIELTNEVKKIVVLGYSEFDTLRAIGLEERVVGAPKGNLPAYLGEMDDRIQDIGSLKEPNLETIASLEPDLIIANGRTADLVPELQKIAPVFVFTLNNENQWEAFVKVNVALATLLGKESDAKVYIEGIERLNQEVAQYNQENPAKNLVLMLNEGNLSAYASNSRFGVIFQVLGFDPVDQEIEESRHGQEISYEGLLSLNPDRIFYLNRTAAIGGDTSNSPVLSENDLVAQTSAGIKKAIFPLTSDLWYLAGEGLESMKLKVEEIKHLVLSAE